MQKLYFIVNKPYLVLSQFSSIDSKKCLLDFFDFPKTVYPVGRLDFNSEGLLILTNDNYLKSHLINPENKHKRKYAVQVEGEVTEEDLSVFEQEMELNIRNNVHIIQASSVQLYEEWQRFPQRVPPIRIRKNIPTTWLEVCVTEGKYHEVRKITAKAGFPTLRLIRISIDELQLGDLETGKSKQISQKTIYRLLGIPENI